MQETATIDPNALNAAQQIVMASWAQQQRTKTVSSTPRNGGYAHGPFGLFSVPGMTREIINAMILPQLGLLKRIPYRISDEAYPIYGILTGQTAESGTFNGTNTHGVCEEPPSAGLLKLCTQTYPFGRQEMETPVIELDRVGLTNNRAEFLDYRLIGGPYSELQPGVPNGPGDQGLQGALNYETAKMSYELAVGWLRQYGPFLYTGNRANNTGGGIILEYNGLDALINTGYRDSITGVVCPRADSYVATFASQNVEVGPAAKSGIVATITGIDRRMRNLASRMGLDPVRWVLVMRPDLFYQLTEVWPCAYNTYRCLAADSGLSVAQPAVNDALRLQAQRDEMRGNWDDRTGQFLWIDGVRREVVLDDTVPETALANGAFNSTIYWIPLTVIGGFQAIYIETRNYDGPNGAVAAANLMAPGASYFTTDNGTFLWHRRPPEGYCVQMYVKHEPRLVLRTPQIAARLTNVGYTPWLHEDDWSTASSVYYFLDGGRTGFVPPSLFSPNTSITTSR